MVNVIEVVHMALQTRRGSGKKGAGARKAARPRGNNAAPPAVAATPDQSPETPAGNAVPQKALLYAVRATEPPAISDEVPDQMPFPTDGQ